MTSIMLLLFFAFSGPPNTMNMQFSLFTALSKPVGAPLSAHVYFRALCFEFSPTAPERVTNESHGSVTCVCLSERSCGCDFYFTVWNWWTHLRSVPVDVLIDSNPTVLLLMFDRGSQEMIPTLHNLVYRGQAKTDQAILPVGNAMSPHAPLADGAWKC